MDNGVLVHGRSADSVVAQILSDGMGQGGLDIAEEVSGVAIGGAQILVPVLFENVVGVRNGAKVRVLEQVKVLERAPRQRAVRLVNLSFWSRDLELQNVVEEH